MIREVVEGEAMEVIDKRKESKDEDWNVGDAELRMLLQKSNQA